MSSEPAVPTYIIASDGLLREGLRLILSNTRFSPNGCAVELDDLTEVPFDRPVLFIIGAGADQAVICSKIRSQYPVAFIVAVADESNRPLLRAGRRSKRSAL
jgi:two-component system, NarL family, nitrate/nitrite response regulator NarL